jgi:hypothetical protein
MPSVDHLSNMGSLNVMLDRVFGGGPPLPPGHTAVGLLTNFVRLVDKSLREYDAARAELLLYGEPHEGLPVSPYLRAIDHMENCISATHRSVLNANALRSLGVGRGAPKLTTRQEVLLTNMRHAVEHSDEKLLGRQKYKSSPPFAPGEPYSLRLASTSMVIGRNALTYRDLVSAMNKMHRAIEKIRRTPTGVPGPNFPNAILRTEVPGRAAVSSGRPSEYLREMARLSISH